MLRRYNPDRHRLSGGPSRRQPRDRGVPRPAGVHLLHLRLDWGAQGRDVRARGTLEPPVRQDRRLADRRRNRGGPDGAAVLRHLVVATGEALKKELVERWFAVQPGIKLVNAYGLTETSDDTNHEIMERAPRGDRVPLGRPVNNVHIYVVDEQLQPVPVGDPGEIVFSGVCVGRGYINDPERTQRAFMQDPLRPGQRLYRSGDYGRALPDGTLEFLGRRDSQVKVHGFRIEIGEVENALLRVDGVRDGAGVVNTHLVAFYSGARPLDSALMRDTLAQSLPAYMVPAAFHWREALPLTENGKIDRKALAALAGELEGGEQNREGAGLATATEQWLA